MKIWAGKLMFRLFLSAMVAVAAGGILAPGKAAAFAMPPYAQTQAAGPVTDTNAIFNGMVAPNGLPTTAWFEWGTNGSYGYTTAPLDSGNGFAVVRVSAGVSNLPPRSKFRCRLVASNDLGVAYGGPVLLVTGQRMTEWGDLRNGLSPIPAGLSNVVAISAEYYQSMALTTAGNVVSWGYAAYGQPAVPAGLSNVVAISCGLYFDLALTQDGRVVAWGRGDAGQTNIPSGLTNVVAISAGFYHGLALKQDGTLAVWGDDSSGQTNVPAGLSNVVAVAAGGYSGVALKADGTAVAWGQAAAVPAGLSNLVAIARARMQSLAIKADGSIVTLDGSTNLPGNIGYAIGVSSGDYHSLALNENGQVFAWGDDSYGQTNVPAGLSNVVAVAAGGYHNVALGNLAPQALAQHLSSLAGQDQVITLAGTDPNSDALSCRIMSLPTVGTLYQWTASGRGAPIAPGALVEDVGNRVILAQPVVADDVLTFTVSDGLLDSSPATVQVDATPAWVFIQQPQAAGPTAMNFAGTVVAGTPSAAWFEWGQFGSYGQTTPPIGISGDGPLVRVRMPQDNLSQDTDYQCRLVVSNNQGVSVGMPVLFTTGRRAFGWGNNNNGQARPPLTLTNAVLLAGGQNDSLAIRADGTVVGWGWNSYNSATPPPGLSNVVDIAGGYFHTIALESNGTVVAWGNNDYGQTNIPLGLSNVVEIAASYIGSLALTAEGQVAVWGGGGVGQTNPPAGLSNVVAIAGGLYHDVALNANGTVAAWGENNAGQASVPNGLLNVVAIAAGNYHSLALRSDGTVVGWGNSSPASVPAGLSNVVAIAAGGDQSLALKADGTLAAWGSITTAVSNVIPGLTNVMLIAAGGGHGLALGRLTPQAQSQAFVGLAGADLTLTLLATDYDNDAMTYRVGSVPATGALFQWTSSGRGAAITTPNTAVADPQGRLIFAPASSLTGWPYATFTFTANNGEADSAAATNTMDIIDAPVITRSLYLISNRVFSLTFNADTNATYRVWASTNLTTWSALGSPTQSAPGLFLYTDPSNSSFGQSRVQYYRTRFYRVTSP